MSCTKGVLEALAKPFQPKDIEWRVNSAANNGKGGFRLLVVPYLESRAVMDRLDQVCGAYWQSEFDKIVVGGKEAFQCRLSIKIDNEWITRTDAAEISDIESVKGGHSNALKRAGVQWGIGRLLYDLPSFWVDLKDRGEHRVYGKFKISGQQQQLSGYFDTPTLPNWALPAEYQKQGKQEGSNQQPNQNKQQSNKQSQNQNNQKQKPSTQQQPNNKPTKQEQEDRQKKAVRCVKGLLQALYVPLNYVPGLLERASGVKVPYEQATVEELEKLYHILSPVHDYVAECRNLGMGEQEMIYYCQITLKVKIESIHALYFKMTREICEQTLELVHGDKTKQAV